MRLSLPAWAFAVLTLTPIPLIFVPLPAGFPEPLRIGLAGLMVAWGLAMTWMHWRGLDEPARAAHKWSWFVGGSAGMAVGLIACAIPLLSPGAADLVHALSAWGKAGDPVTRTFFYGAAFAGMAQVIGFAVAWLLWWAPKR
jgi:hypothetical protein